MVGRGVCVREGVTEYVRGSADEGGEERSERRKEKGIAEN